MSYFLDSKNERAPGPVSGNAGGINERVLISVRKVFDAGIRQTVFENLIVNAGSFSIPDPVPPFTFTAARNLRSEGVLSDLIIERLEDRPRLARVRVNIGVPLAIAFTDANGTAVTAEAEHRFSLDVILAVSEPSIIPYSFEAIVSATAARGSHLSGNSFSLDLCLTTILKIVIDADILVPTYGYARFPKLEDYIEDIGCSVFDLPLYPENKRK